MAALESGMTNDDCFTALRPKTMHFTSLKTYKGVDDITEALFTLGKWNIAGWFEILV